MVRQCFDSLNIYGKEPEQVENMILMFVHALQEYELPEIKRAFVDWVKGHAEMPTPAGIIEIIQGNRPKPVVKYYTSTPEEYAAAQEAKKRPKTVPWHRKTWADFTEEDKRLLAIHLVAIGPEKAEDYEKYLKDHAKAPVNLLHELQVSFS